MDLIKDYNIIKKYSVITIMKLMLRWVKKSDNIIYYQITVAELEKPFKVKRTTLFFSLRDDGSVYVTTSWYDFSGGRMAVPSEESTEEDLYTMALRYKKYKPTMRIEKNNILTHNDGSGRIITLTIAQFKTYPILMFMGIVVKIRIAIMRVWYVIKTKLGLWPREPKGNNDEQ